jgi:hypothetical protein
MEIESRMEIRENVKEVHTPAVVLVVDGALEQGPHLLEVLLSLVQGVLDGADLLELVRAPVGLVGEHEEAEGIVDGVCDGGQQGADGLWGGAVGGGVIVGGLG